MTTPVLPGTVPTFIRATIPQPALGAEWSVTVPNGTSTQAWPGGPSTGATPVYARLLLGFCTFTSGVATTNRWVGCKVGDAAGNQIAAISIDGNNALPVSTANFQQPLMYMRSFCFDSVGVINVASANPSVGLTGGANWGAIIMGPGYTFGSSTPGLTGGDQYSSVELWMEQWTSAPIWDGGTVQLF